MRGGPLRVLDNSDLDAVIRLLIDSPLENLYVASRVRVAGLDQRRLGCQVVGYECNGRLVAICYAGSNLMPIGDDPAAIAAFIEWLGPRRFATSIMGRSDVVGRLWEGLSDRWGRSWRGVREFRAHQPLMAIDRDADGPVDPRVHRIAMSDFEPYFDASVKMYTEEVGVSPLDPTHSYRAYVRQLIDGGRAFGIVEDGRVIYKSDIGAFTAMFCQVQGVWLEPSLRGQRLSEPAMASVVKLARERHRVVSLYVNDFNVRARRLYERIGFITVGELATVLY